MHRNNVVKNPIHFVTENLFIKYKIAANLNFVNKVEKVHEVAKFKKWNLDNILSFNCALCSLFKSTKKAWAEII